MPRQNPPVGTGPWCQSVQQGCNADGGPPRPTPKPSAPPRPTPKPSAPPTQQPTVACPDNQAVDTDSRCQFWDISRGHCEDTTDDVKEKMKACQKTCGVCVAPSAACTNTKQGKFKVIGVKQKKKCQWYARKGKCNKKIADGSGRVFTVCAKSCATTTKQGEFKLEGSKQKKTCDKWAQKG